MRSQDPLVVLVDGADRELGLMPRSLAHRGQGHRHRAFTALVFDSTGRLLLARRAAHKALWPGAYDGTVASHPLPGETVPNAARRRLMEELGVELQPEPIGRFDYRVVDGPRGGENELCWTLWAVLPPGASPAPDPHEIDRLEWLDPNVLLAAPERWPSICPWLWPALACLAGASMPLASLPAATACSQLPDSLKPMQAGLRLRLHLDLAHALEQAFAQGAWRLL